MELRLIHNHEYAILLLKLSGKGKTAEIPALLDAIWNSQEYNQDYRFLADISELDLQINSADLLKNNRYIKNHKSRIKGKGAVVVNNPLLTAAISFILKFLNNHNKQMCFYKRESAIAEMDIPASLLDDLDKAPILTF